MGGTQHADQILNSLGLAPVDTSALMNQLSPAQQQALSQLSGQALAMTSSELSGAFSNFVSSTVINYQDVNALVQQVLREAYSQNTEDLRMYAEKVKFYNQVKEALRDELGKARKALTAAGPGEAETELSGPFSPTHTSATYTGNQEISTSGPVLERAMFALPTRCLRPESLPVIGKSRAETVGILWPSTSMETVKFQPLMPRMACSTSAV